MNHEHDDSPVPGGLSDQDLLARTLQLAAAERQATALLIAHLAELDARRLYLAEGYSSLFTYCRQALRLSEHAAYGRIEAARAVQRFPVILEIFSEGTVTLTTVGLLAPHLTTENHEDLLDRTRGKSKRAVEELIAELAPQPPIPAVVRRLPAAGHHTVSPVLPDGAHAGAPAPLATLPPAAPPPGRPATVAPLAPQRYKVQFTARAETCEKLRLALRVRGGVRAPLHRDGLPGVPPCEAARRGWRVHDRQHPVALARA